RHIVGGALGHFRRSGQWPACSSYARLSEFADGAVRHFFARQAGPASYSSVCRSYRPGLRAFWSKCLKHNRRSAHPHGGPLRVSESRLLAITATIAFSSDAFARTIPRDIFMRELNHESLDSMQALSPLLICYRGIRPTIADD